MNLNSKKEPFKKKRKTFINRSDFMASTEFPKSNNQRIIIPSNSSGNGFIKKQYVHEYLSSYLSEQEFSSVVDQFSLIVMKLHSKKRHNDNSHLAKSTKRLLLLGIVLAIIFCVFFYQGSIRSSKGVVITALTLLGVDFVIITYLYFYYVFWNRKRAPSFEEEVKEKLDIYFNEINRKYIEKGLYWRVV